MFGLSHHPTQTKFEVTKFEVTMSSKNFDMKCFWTWRIFQTLNAITNQWASISNNDDTYRIGALLTKSQEDSQTSLKFAKAQSGLKKLQSDLVAKKACKRLTLEFPLGNCNEFEKIRSSPT